MALKKATKEQAKLRLAIYGLSGGGKTYSSLAIAKGLTEVFGGKIAVLDTEFRSASKYANTFDFVTDDFSDPTIENYLAFIDMVKEDPEVTVLIIDSLTHAWQWCLGEVDRLTKTSSKADSRSAWKVVSPKYDKLVNAILTAPFHVIGTMRAKTEWSTDKESGNKATRRDTLAPVQREGFEYEFDMLMEMSAYHFGTVIKDRSGKFQDEVIEKPGISFGKKLAEWLKDGSPALPPPAPGKTPEQNKPKPEKTERQIVIDGIAATLKALNPDTLEFFTDEEKNKAKADIAKTKETEDIEALKKLASDLKKELEKRQAEYKPIPFGDDPAPETPAPAEETPAAPAGEKTETPEQVTTPPPEDNFQDDIPWGDGEEPGKGKKGKGKAQGKPEAGTDDLDIF